MVQQNFRFARGRFSRWSLIGVACVLAGAALAASAYLQSQHTGKTVALMATHTLPAGFRVQAVDFASVLVAVPSEFARHLVSAAHIGDRRLARSIAAGSVLTESDLEADRAEDFSRVTVDVGRMPMRLSRGDTVDLWATPDAVTALAAPDSDTVVAHRVASNLIVMAVGDASVGSGRAVELQVPGSQVGRVIQATHSGSIDVVIRESASS